MQELKAREARKSSKNSSKISRKPRKNSILTKKTYVSWSRPTNSYRTNVALSNASLKNLLLKELPWNPLFRSLFLRTRWLVLISQKLLIKKKKLSCSTIS